MLWCTLDTDNLAELWVDLDGEHEGTEEAQRLLPPTSPAKAFSIRAVASANIMDGFAHVLAEHGRPGSEAEADRLFNLSFASNSIDYFISHSWSAARVWKWAALADFYNRSAATALANIAWLALSLLGFLWRLQTERELQFAYSFIIFICLPSFLIVALTALGHHLTPWLGSKVFLDRVCIHQWDEDLKEDGVKSLGQVLWASGKMMVLWSSDYFQRMWCFFEIAVFSHRKGPADMLFLPLWRTPMLYGLLLGSVCVTFVCAMAEQQAAFVPLLAAFGTARGLGMHFMSVHVLPAGLICCVIRRSIREKRILEKQLANFSVSNAQVSVSTDRDFIMGHIRHLFGGAEAFEDFVRDELHRSVYEIVGAPWQVPFKYGAFGFQPYLWYMSCNAMSMTNEQALSFGCANWKVYSLANIQYYGWIYALMPITLKGAAFSAHWTLTWPFALGLLVDVCVFMGMVFFITYTSASVYELCFLSVLDTSLVQPPNWAELAAFVG